MADHRDDVAAVDALVRALLHERFTGEDDDPARRALLDRMASLRAAASRELDEAEYERDGLRIELAFLRTPRPRAEWKESDGTVLWWRLPVEEPPYVGDLREDDFPDDVTHWTPLPVVVEPAGSSAPEACPACTLGECREHDAQAPCDVFVHVRDAAAIRTRDCGGDGHHLCRKCAAYEEP